MNHAERRIAIFYRVGDHAHGQQVVNLVEVALLLLNFQVHGIQPLGARLHFRGDAAFDHLLANCFLHFQQEFIEDLLLGGNFFLQLEKCFRLEITEGQIFELAANQAHAQAVGDGRVDIQRLAGDALLALAVEISEGAHVMQAIGELHHHHANVVDHGQQHLADVFGLARLGRQQVEPADLGDAFHQPRHVGPELLGNLFQGDFGVFDYVVKQRGAQRGHVQPHVREQMSDFHGMRKVGLAGAARLRLVLLGGEIVGAAQEFEIVARPVAMHLVGQLDEAQVHRAPRGDADDRIARRVHISLF